MYALGIDTSNYATSLAVIDYTAGEVVCDLKRFLPVKEGDRGIRQSDAVFHHVQALPQMMKELFDNVDSCKVDKVGVSVSPRSVDGSYMPCFSAGYSVAYSFALAKKINLVQTSHQNGHIAAAVFALRDTNFFIGKKLVFHVSGGTTELLLCDGTTVEKTLYSTKDLYAGQAVDRVGVKLGMRFPAGEILSELALSCTERIKPKISMIGGNCSFSGLENQCNLLLEKNFAPNYIAKYCLSQIAYTISEMLKIAKIEYHDLPMICAGGVMCSETAREIILSNFKDAKFVDSKYSSDNAIGVAVIAERES